MKTSLVLLLIVFTFYGCASNSEQKGIDAVLEYYGGNIKYTKGFSATTSEGKKSYFELELSNIEFINEFGVVKTSSNSARLFFNSLTPEEKEKYSQIIVKLHYFVDGVQTMTTHEFDTDDLVLVSKREYLFKKATELLKNHDYDKLINTFSPLAAGTFDKESITNDWLGIEERFGDIKEERIDGFQLYENKVEGKLMKYLKIMGVHIRTKETIKFNIIIKQDPDDEYIYGLSFN